jgi:hypothetical protein
MEVGTTHRPSMVVFGIADWLVRITVPVMVLHTYGLLAGIATGMGLIAASEVCWRLTTGEWGNLWPSRLIRRRRTG